MKYAYPVDRFCLVVETDHVSNLKMVVFEMTSITVRRRDRVVPGFPSGKGNDFIGRYLRESSFNMTRGADEDIETRSLKF